MLPPQTVHIAESKLLALESMASLFEEAAPAAAPATRSSGAAAIIATFATYF